MHVLCTMHIHPVGLAHSNISATTATSATGLSLFFFLCFPFFLAIYYLFTGASDLMAHRPTYDPYLDNLKSPLIKDESDGKTLRLRFDVANYKPEEVTVKTIDNRLLVHAKHEEKTPQRTVFREYNQVRNIFFEKLKFCFEFLTFTKLYDVFAGIPSAQRHQPGANLVDSFDRRCSHCWGPTPATRYPAINFDDDQSLPNYVKLNNGTKSW